MDGMINYMNRLLADAQSGAEMDSGSQDAFQCIGRLLTEFFDFTTVVGVLLTLGIAGVGWILIAGSQGDRPLEWFIRFVERIQRRSRSKRLWKVIQRMRRRRACFIAMNSRFPEERHRGLLVLSQSREYEIDEILKAAIARAHAEAAIARAEAEAAARAKAERDRHLGKGGDADEVDDLEEVLEMEGDDERFTKRVVRDVQKEHERVTNMVCS